MVDNSLEKAISARQEGIPDHRVVGRSADRLLGAFYTNATATEIIARWAVRAAGESVLEPSFGDGAFLRAVQQVVKHSKLSRVQVFGAELIRETHDQALEQRLLPAKNAILGDFLGVEPFPVDSVVGNPPYVRLRHLPADQRERAMNVARRVLGEPMETSGSVWMPFVLHSLQFLRRGGRLALVLPYELTYVRYAQPLWRVLGESFEDLHVIRTHERLFPDILQEVVLLFADGYGGSTKTVLFQAIEHASQLSDAARLPHVALPVADIVAGKRVFVEALLPERTRGLLAGVLEQSTAPLPERCPFNIGYVTGDRDFFHPDADTVAEYHLPQSHLRPALTSSRQLKSVGLRTSGSACVPDQLYLPAADAELSDSETAYIEKGEREGLHKRYKCRVREPWYVVPGVRVPDVVLSVFAERPVLVVNDAGLVASNSLLCGYLRSGTAEELAAAWYTSLTIIQCELQVHSLGGGVFILVPGEVGNLRLPTCPARKPHLAAIDRHLREGQLEAAYQCGDSQVLEKQLHLSAAEIEELRTGIELLKHWRNSSRGHTINEKEEIV